MVSFRRRFRCVTGSKRVRKALQSDSSFPTGALWCSLGAICSCPTWLVHAKLRLMQKAVKPVPGAAEYGCMVVADMNWGKDNLAIRVVSVLK